MICTVQIHFIKMSSCEKPFSMFVIIKIEKIIRWIFNVECINESMNRNNFK